MKFLGAGEFCSVFSSTLDCGDPIAVKMLRPNKLSSASAVRDLDFEMHLIIGGGVALRWSADATARLRHLDDEVTAGGELVEVVPSHICVQVEVLGGLGCRDAVVAGMGEQEDVAASRITECCRDRRDR